MDKYFYCYSYKLMRFLKLEDISYIKILRHKNGKRIWLYDYNKALCEKLEKWNKYKQYFLEGEGRKKEDD